MACASDVLGVIPDTTYSFIKRSAKAYSARSGKPYADCLSICCKRISFSIRLGVARQLTASKMFLDNLFEDHVEDGPQRGLHPDGCQAGGSRDVRAGVGR